MNRGLWETCPLELELHSLLQSEGAHVDVVHGARNCHFSQPLSDLVLDLSNLLLSSPERILACLPSRTTLRVGQHGDLGARRERICHVEDSVWSLLAEQHLLSLV
jgi:hypothetical protein